MENLFSYSTETGRDINFCSDLSADLNFAEMRSITYGLILEQEYE